MKKNLPPIHNLETLRAEKSRLSVIEAQQREMVMQDVDFLKKQFSALNLMNKAAISIVPETVRHSGIINGVINIIANRVFRADTDVVEQETDKGKNEKLRNIILGLAEGVGTFLLARYLKRKIL